MTEAVPKMSFADLERVYTRLAETIDQVGPDREALFLAKLALILAQQNGDPKAVTDAIEAALQDLD